MAAHFRMLTFDCLSKVFISNTNYEENQPAQLTLKNNAGHQTGVVCWAGEPTLFGRCVRNREERGGTESSANQRKTACTARLPTSGAVHRISSGLCMKLAEDRIIQVCKREGSLLKQIKQALLRWPDLLGSCIFKNGELSMFIYQYFMFCLCEDYWPAAGWYEVLPIGLIEDEI